MTLTIDIKESVADKILYFLEHFEDDVKIIENNSHQKSDKYANELSNHTDKIELALHDAKAGKGRRRGKIGEL